MLWKFDTGYILRGNGAVEYIEAFFLVSPVDGGSEMGLYFGSVLHDHGNGAKGDPILGAGQGHVIAQSR